MTEGVLQPIQSDHHQSPETYQIIDHIKNATVASAVISAFTTVVICFGILFSSVGNSDDFSCCTSDVNVRLNKERCQLSYGFTCKKE